MKRKRVTYYTLLREVDLGGESFEAILAQLGSGVSEERDVCAALDLEELKQYALLIRAGAKHWSALARALDFRQYADMYDKLSHNAEAKKYRTTATSYRCSMAVILKANLLENDQGEYSKMSKKDRQEFIGDLLDFWASRN